ncbi:sugar ABC transporter substrate-binding protein [Micromonospora sp. NPDC005197]|uniref:sugar ABC transporter substrate-binding protein n=1 Tax=unclassified Micromonospora TaxID=2617518 RepID=UPI00339FEF93
MSDARNDNLPSLPSRRNFLRGVSLIGGAAVGGSLLAACSSKEVDNSPTGGGGGNGGSPISQKYDDAVRKIVNGRTIQIGYTVPVLSEYFNEIQGAAWRKMAEYEERFGVKWKWERSAPTANYKSVEQHVGIVQNWATRKFDAIFICTSANFATMQGVYQRAAEQGTMVIEYNMPIELYPADQLRTAATVGYQNETQSGYLAGKYIGDKLNGKGRVLALFGPAGSDYSKMRGDGLKRAFAEYPDVKLVAQADGGYVRDKGFAVAQDLLAANKDINAIYGENEDMALGASQAIDQAGLKHWDGKEGILTIGADGLVSGCEKIREGKLTASVDVGPVDNGLRLVETMFNRVVLGKNIDKVTYVGTQIIDKSNVDAPQAYLQWALDAKKY